jgi:hypothetical protein
MFIIFGHKGKVDFDGVYWGKCPSCSGEGAISVFLAKKFITLFFIPVIPYSTKFYIKCNMCSKEWNATQEESENIRDIKEKGDLLNLEEFQEKYKGKLEKIDKQRAEFRKKFVKFLASDEKKDEKSMKKFFKSLEKEGKIKPMKSGGKSK